MFNWFTKEIKEVKEEPKVKPELTLEERIKLFKERNSELIERFDKEDENQIIFNVGDVVKLNVPNSPEMIVKSFSERHYSISEYGGICSFYSIVYDRELKFALYRHYENLCLKYFDANLVLHEIDADPKEVIKIESN